MELIQKIQEVISKFMASGLSFSAHDVTVELRVQNKNIFHGQVKDQIHVEVASVMVANGYEKTFEKSSDGSTYQLYSKPISGTKPKLSVPSSFVLTPVISVNDFVGRDLDFEEDSSWITKARWNSQTEELFVETKSGASYIYQNVDAKTVLEWEVADSVGSYFNESIKTEFTFTKN